MGMARGKQCRVFREMPAALPHPQGTAGEAVSAAEAKEEAGLGCKSSALSKTPLPLPGRVKKPGGGAKGRGPLPDPRNHLLHQSRKK